MSSAPPKTARPPACPGPAQVGEGLQAEQKDFAAEVAETLKSVS